MFNALEPLISLLGTSLSCFTGGGGDPVPGTTNGLVEVLLKVVEKLIHNITA